MGALVLLLTGADGRREQSLLVVVVAIQRSCGDSGRLGDVLELHRMEAALGEQSNGLLEDLILAVLRPAFDCWDGGLHRARPPFLLARTTKSCQTPPRCGGGDVWWRCGGFAGHLGL